MQIPPRILATAVTGLPKPKMMGDVTLLPKLAVFCQSPPFALLYLADLHKREFRIATRLLCC
jgi:hypothetical protein